MSLIDKEINLNKNTENNQNQTSDLLCKDCNKKISKESFILLCEDCFNKSITNTLNHIKENIIKINIEIRQVEAQIYKIQGVFSSEPKLHIMIINKLQIDLLNFEAIKKKLMIDKELNEKAFVINQEQANKIRSELKWSLCTPIPLEMN